MSKTDIAILGLLTVEPMSGYDLKKVCEQSLAHFWHASFGNLYPRLKHLAALGLIRGSRQARARGPDAIVYTLTRSGRAQLRKCLQEPPEQEHVQSEFTLKIFLGAHTDLARTERMVLDHEREQTRIRDGYKATEQSILSVMRRRPEAAYWMMALKRGQLLTEARLRWCQECRAMIEKMRNREGTR